MTALPDFDAYEALGVTKDATTAEIKSSHRKLVLKCHPDKIKDEALREQAQDQFQKVQQAYECLSDETMRTKYDNKVKLAGLKREMAARSGAYSRPNPREYRDGRIYEERVPTDPDTFFEDEERFAESPRSTSRKHEEYGTRPRSRATDEKRRSKAASSSSAARAYAREKEVRESAKATRADQDKYRTKERRREFYAKHYVDESESSGSEADVYYIPVKQPSKAKRYTKSSKPTESTRRSRAHYRDEDDDHSDEPGRDSYKHDRQYSTARDYIRRSKETIADPERRHRSSRSPLGYGSPEPETSRRSGRSTRSTRPPTSHHSSFENLEPLPRSHDKVSMPTSATFPGPTSSPKPSKGAWVRSPSRSNRESSHRESTRRSGYAEPRTTKLRGEKSDSGYASSSPTPDIPEASPKPSRYKDSRPNPVIVEPRAEPPPLRHSRTYSPPHAERRMPPRSTTYSYPAEPSSRKLWGEVDSKFFKERHRSSSDRPDVQYIRPPYQSHAHSDYPRHASHASRRPSVY
ncbi:hypothetical protein BDV06DRAFT_176852 [Aspergillus oleicola]